MHICMDPEAPLLVRVLGTLVQGRWHSLMQGGHAVPQSCTCSQREERPVLWKERGGLRAPLCPQPCSQEPPSRSRQQMCYCTGAAPTPAPRPGLLCSGAPPLGEVRAAHSSPPHGAQAHGDGGPRSSHRPSPTCPMDPTPEAPPAAVLKSTALKDTQAWHWLLPLPDKAPQPSTHPPPTPSSRQGCSRGLSPGSWHPQGKCTPILL